MHHFEKTQDSRTPRLVAIPMARFRETSDSSPHLARRRSKSMTPALCLKATPSCWCILRVLFGNASGPCIRINLGPAGLWKDSPLDNEPLAQNSSLEGSQTAFPCVPTPSPGMSPVQHEWLRCGAHGERDSVRVVSKSQR
jgi:hypothetical protein